MMSGEAWFRPKRFGYGATPVNWKGWLFVAATVAIFMVSAAAFVRSIAAHPETAAVVRFVSFTGIWLAWVTWVTLRKTEGEWRWRWGRREGGENRCRSSGWKCWADVR